MVCESMGADNVLWRWKVSSSGVRRASDRVVEEDNSVPIRLNSDPEPDWSSCSIADGSTDETQVSQTR